MTMVIILGNIDISVAPLRPWLSMAAAGLPIRPFYAWWPLRPGQQSPGPLQELSSVIDLSTMTIYRGIAYSSPIPGGASPLWYSRGWGWAAHHHARGLRRPVLAPAADWLKYWRGNNLTAPAGQDRFPPSSSAATGPWRINARFSPRHGW
jgi:hypothetical protein